jgi:membrane protein implicated in regulation of membrane protease activity
MIWFLLLLIVLIATGAFWLVLKIALGVALGVFLGILAITAFVMWRVRKAMKQAMNPPEGPAGLSGSSQITIDYRPDYGDHRSDYSSD